MTELHELRLQTVIEQVLMAQAKTVLDLGCGQGQLISELAKIDSIEKIVGVDISATELAIARDNLNAEGLWFEKDIELIHQSFDRVNANLIGFDAAIMLETVEHIEPRYLSRIEHAIFSVYQPRLVIMTTPNVGYNPMYGLQPGETRHPEHKFEWTRLQFKKWCEGVAVRCNYRVELSSIGEEHLLLGSSTQMASFRFLGSGRPSIV
ncbi:class I SAM-dependent methyltransferase [Limnobacter sp.]|uniref:class I SAM-dependent methyltransferase n=1 Tax=Limnobacter sp. TaxID=2003368 RepID=UPI00391DABB0